MTGQELQEMAEQMQTELAIAYQDRPEILEALMRMQD